MNSRLFLIDGHALIFKMYYAFVRKPMINSKGADMSILFGFTKYLLELISREKPTHIAVSFDPPGGTFRNEMYPLYKANRAETPQLVVDALEPLMELCRALNIQILMVKGYEADDVIGTVATKLASDEVKVFMVTPDKDYGQLINANISQLKPGKAGEPDILIDTAAVCGKYGISNPAQVIEMLTLCGDSADNVPGVKGVGEVGAGKLISKYSTVENIYKHLDELPPKQQTMFNEAKEHIGLSHSLVTIKTDVPLQLSLDSMAVNTAYSSELADLFDKYEFNSLKRFLGDVKISAKSGKLEYSRVSVEDFLMMKPDMVSIVSNHGISGFFSSVGSIAVSTEIEGKCYVTEASASQLKTLIENPQVAKCGCDLKKLLNLLRFNEIELRGNLDDIELMHYLTDPEKSHRLEVLSRNFLNVDLEQPDGEIPVETSLFDLSSHKNDKSLLAEAVACVLLDTKMREEMQKASVTTLYEQMEEPLIRVLAKMEYEGVKVDLRQLDSYALELRKEVSEMENNVREIAQNPSLNLSSPKQIGTLLFEQLNLDPRAKKSSKGSWSTDETTLQAIASRHPVVDQILEFREVKKLLSTYIDPFPNYVSPVTGKIHTTFNQALTATGRLSSSNPNLQNIPIRSERGREIRKSFVPSKADGLILSADYSQIELRIMAHLCGDKHMIEAFRQGVDVHSATAEKIFGIPHGDVTAEQRRIAKTANFGIMYGISSFGLAQRLKISRGEAKKIIDDYFEVFPSIKEFISQTIQSAREKGYVETIFGRKRYLPDINSKNATIRALAERNAVNAPIQGTAADVIKISMIGIDRKIQEAGLKSRMVLQIHDELLFDTCADEAERLKRLVADEMENVISLSIPLTVECGYGKNWLEAH